ncbi:MAG: hypothetical protein H6658_06405 [Ardenticatenaceae bacterium]|nr:hypothetical protein [Ardenticatenaceae bacterium]
MALFGKQRFDINKLFSSANFPITLLFGEKPTNNLFLGAVSGIILIIGEIVKKMAVFLKSVSGDDNYGTKQESNNCGHCGKGARFQKYGFAGIK